MNYKFNYNNNKTGKRYSLPNARIMIHQPIGSIQGSVTDMEIQVPIAVPYFGTELVKFIIEWILSYFNTQHCMCLGNTLPVTSLIDT